MEKLTREQKVLKYLEKYKKITALEAYRECGTMRLSAAIYNLKKQGYNFDTQSVRVPTRDGWTYVAEYTLLGRWLDFGRGKCKK